MAVGFPMHGVFVPRQRLLKGAWVHLFIVFGYRSFPGDDSAWKHNVAVVRAGRLCKPKQRVLAGAARPDHQNQPARPDGHGLIGGDGRYIGHATRCPSRQTLRTTGTSRATWTRIKSARFPTAISPRSMSPTASAGALVTVRTADARSIAGTCRGNCNAPISRLEGM